MIKFFRWFVCVKYFCWNYGTVEVVYYDNVQTTIMAIWIVLKLYFKVVYFNFCEVLALKSRWFSHNSYKIFLFRRFWLISLASCFSGLLLFSIKILLNSIIGESLQNATVISPFFIDQQLSTWTHPFVYCLWFFFVRPVYGPIISIWFFFAGFHWGQFFRFCSCNFFQNFIFLTVRQLLLNLLWFWFNKLFLSATGLFLLFFIFNAYRFRIFWLLVIYRSLRNLFFDIFLNLDFFFKINFSRYLDPLFNFDSFAHYCWNFIHLRFQIIFFDLSFPFFFFFPFHF